MNDVCLGWQRWQLALLIEQFDLLYDGICPDTSISVDGLSKIVQHNVVSAELNQSFVDVSK